MLKTIQDFVNEQIKLPQILIWIWLGFSGFVVGLIYFQKNALNSNSIIIQKDDWINYNIYSVFGAIVGMILANLVFGYFVKKKYNHRFYLIFQIVTIYLLILINFLSILELIYI